MLDEKDLQAIAQLLDVRLAQQKTEIMTEVRQEMSTQLAQQKVEIQQEVGTQFVQQKTDIMHEVRLMMESYFDPKFNYLADALNILQETVVRREEVEQINDRLDVLEAVVKLHTQEIETLKKAQ